MKSFENIKKMIGEGWFRSAVVGGIFTLIGVWSFGLFGADVKIWLISSIQDEFFRWGVGVAAFAVLSDIFFAFVVRK